MKKHLRPSYETIKRFALSATEYETSPQICHCNTAKVWQSYLRSHFIASLKLSEINFEKFVSNSAYRISGLELKIGLLLSDDEFRFSEKKLLSDAVVPSIVIDSVLAVFGILEGLSMLSYLTSLDNVRRKIELRRMDRGDKIEKGLRSILKRNVTREVKALRTLRDRCMHQDYADRQHGMDYEHMFNSNSIRQHVGLLYEYLIGLETDGNKMPDTNLDEFWHFPLPTITQGAKQ